MFDNFRTIPRRILWVSSTNRSTVVSWKTWVSLHATTWKLA